MKVMSSIKCICKNCKFIKRSKILYVICKFNKKHNQRQG